MKQSPAYFLFLLLSARPLSAGAQGLSAFGDFLYWHASEATSSFWSNVIASPSNDVLSFSPQNIDFNWSGGFRAGLSYESERKSWDTRLYWTHFQTDKSLNRPPAANQLVWPEFFSGFLSGDLFAGANADCRLVMNTFDLETSRRFDIGRSFLSPSIGIRGAIIDQTIDARYDALIYVSAENVKNDFYGAGPSFGIRGAWNPYHDVSLIGNFSTAFMWGNWNVKDTYSRPSALLGAITPTTITTAMNDSELGTLTFDYFVGLEWRHRLAASSRLAVQLGYEMQYWANQLRLLTFEQLPTHGDLTLQGLTCGIHLYF